MGTLNDIQHFRTYTAGREPLGTELLDGEWFINMIDGVAFFKDIAGNVRRVRALEAQTFNVTLAGQTNFNVLATATEILSFTVNGLDYSEFVTINPAGSGTVVYDDIAGGYVIEVGDYVKISYF